MSSNEWQKATEAHFSDNVEYVVIRVANVGTSPTVSDVLIDPYRLSREGKLRFSTGDLIVYVGEPRADTEH
jgi:hypothetical protein